MKRTFLSLIITSIFLFAHAQDTPPSTMMERTPLDDQTFDLERERMLMQDRVQADPDKKAFKEKVTQGEKEQVEIQVTPEQLLTQPAILIQLTHNATRDANIPLLKILFPVYRQLPAEYQDEFVIVYAHALISTADMKFGEAIKAYRYILSQNPNLPVIQHRLAQTLFIDKQYTDSKEIFEELRGNESLPKEVRAASHQYLGAIKERTKTDFTVGGNIIQDGNLNGSNGETVYLSPTDSVKMPKSESGYGLAYNASLGKDFNIKGNHYLRLSTSIYGQYYVNNKEYNDTIWRVYFGYGYEDFNKSIYLTPFYEKRWYGQSPFSHGLGVRLSYSQLLSPKFRLMNSIEYQKKNHSRRRNHLSGDLYSFNSTLMYAHSRDQFFFGGFGWNKEDLNTTSNSYVRRSIRAGWGKQWGHNISTNMQASYAEKNYYGPDVFQITKRNKEYSANFSIWRRDIQFWEMTPKLTVSWQKTESNHFMQKYDRTRVFLDVTKNF